MALSRRSFLAGLGFGTVAAAAAASGVLDIERLLWVPDEKTIFLPTLVAPVGASLSRGDLFTITGVYAVNPVTRIPLSVLQTFVVTADVYAGHVLDVSRVHPRLITDGVYANVSSWPVRSRKIDGTLIKPMFCGAVAS